MKTALIIIAAATCTSVAVSLAASRALRWASCSEDFKIATPGPRQVQVESCTGSGELSPSSPDPEDLPAVKEHDLSDVVLNDRIRQANRLRWATEMEHRVFGDMS